MNRRILLLLGTISLLIGIILLIDTKLNNNLSKVAGTDFTVDSTLKIDNCAFEKNCDIESNYVYYTISHTNKNKELQSVINKINSEVKQKYKETLNSKTKNNSECSKVSSKYKYSMTSRFDYNLYENDDYISISYIISDISFCGDTSNNLEPKVYIFSKKDDKIITQKEFQNKLEMTDEEINNYIDSQILTLNNSLGTNYSLEYNVKNGKPVKMLFYNQSGELSIYFYQSIDNSYQVASI